MNRKVCKTTDLNKQQDTPKKRTRSKFRLEKSTIAVYLGVFTLVIALVMIGYHKPQSAVASFGASSLSVDNVVATSVAADVAQSTDLPIASSVSNMASSAQVKSEIAQTSSDSSSVAKPQIIVSSTNMAVTSYTVKAGDTVTSVAAQFGLSTDTIKWANGLTADELTVGTILKILPVNGILYTVKDGDTVDSVASKYQVDKTRLITYNNLDASGNLSVGSSIILPGGILPTNERPGYSTTTTSSSSAPTSSSSSATSYNFRAGSVGNLYAAGNCTWWAYERRVQLGNPVGSYWGNASTWAYAAAASGYLVDRNPSAGAVLVMSPGQAGNGYGHVAIVERVNSDGSIVISEMNNYAYGGWNIVDNQTISSGKASEYKYIH